MAEVSPKDQYERTLLEMVLRHKLPDNCDVHIEVDHGGQKAAAKFSLADSHISVDSNISSLNLNRILMPAPPNW